MGNVAYWRMLYGNERAVTPALAADIALGADAKVEQWRGMVTPRSRGSGEAADAESRRRWRGARQSEGDAAEQEEDGDDEDVCEEALEARALGEAERSDPRERAPARLPTAEEGSGDVRRPRHIPGGARREAEACERARADARAATEDAARRQTAEEQLARERWQEAEAAACERRRAAQETDGTAFERESRRRREAARRERGGAPASGVHGEEEDGGRGQEIERPARSGKGRAKRADMKAAQKARQ